MTNIAIVGGGGIGKRHLQSCCDLPSDFKIHVVDPSPESITSAQEAAAGKGREDIVWLADIGSLPREIDFAVVATRADIRSTVIRELLAAATVKNLLLEKVLFQTLAEYREIGDLLTGTGTKAWVNCPTRNWPGYLEVRRRIGGQAISSISLSGGRWDIGCNAVHYLDLFAFLLGSSKIHISDIDVVSAFPAKRNGMLHIEGAIAGSIMRENGAVPLKIISNPSLADERTLEIDLKDGALRTVEGIDKMTVSYPGGEIVEYPVPFQSQLTSGVVRAVLSTGDCGLPDYSESRSIHEPLITGFLRALSSRSLLDDVNRCPVT